MKTILWGDMYDKKDKCGGNCGHYVSEQIPEKNFKLLHGGCPIHASVSESEAVAAKEKHPGAPLLVHPECVPDVVKHADYVGSTSGITEYAKNSDKKEFIINISSDKASFNSALGLLVFTFFSLIFVSSCLSLSTFTSFMALLKHSS